ncbi:DUF4236 domain-containing protein [Desulfurispirillum indicum]|uniref:Tetratricopeptide TPR_1 repeat-containing protein n=1 Tax=Desulfurispirillum indicum (strain ATCC BAA-1389 / DSM 22839 / S5) TaxID=653733 RepID=E6W6F3_DESIS|nr:DUF4236 domain-containing protein [Desulfurispirillum indicum]ADU67288.1 Tetratricopeptide TPR_1 repeat-containing protein [Desulfurispirillum indicum S5]UCZ56660.1 DUF4236 domain-containing protein [Desulfurispirillum indicum]
MSFRFFRRIRLAPGISLNLSKSGGSISLGPRGARMTVGHRGVRTTLGLPGSGLYYTDHESWAQLSRRNSSAVAPSRETVCDPSVVQQTLHLGFFRRLVTPAREIAFINGLRHFVEGNFLEALHAFERGRNAADNAFMAGFCQLKSSRFQDAVQTLTRVEEQHHLLGQLFEKYRLNLRFDLSITEEVTAHITPSRRGVLLALAEAHQELQQYDAAQACLQTLLKLNPDDVVVRVSLVEIMLETIPEESTVWEMVESDGIAARKCVRRPTDPAAWQEVVDLCENVENESSVHSVLMLYKARALQRLGQLAEARDTLTAALRRRKDRSEIVLRSLRYERALVYELMGEKARAREEFSRILAEDPGFEDVAERLQG